MKAFLNYSVISGIKCFSKHHHLPDGAWSWDTFISPFSKKTWIVTIANIIASSLVLFVTHYFRVTRKHKKRTTARGDCKKEDEQFNFVNSIFTAFSAQVQQGENF